MTRASRRAGLLSRGAALTLGAVAGLVLAVGSAQAAAKIQRVVSPGGIEAWLVEEYAIPMVALEISWEGGARLDPEGREGLANLLAGTLEEGAGDLDAVGFAEAADDLAARFSYNAGRDSVSVGARMLVENLEPSVDLLRLALVETRFDPEPVERVKGQILSSIRSREADPNALAAEAFMAAVFPGDRYGAPTDGTAESVAAITPEDLRAIRGEMLNVERAKIGVVGAISAETLGPLLDRLLGDLPRADWERAAPAEYVGAPGVTVIDFDSPQTAIFMGHEGILRSDPDFIPAYVMNYVLGGGGFVSRLTTEVREKRGLAYSTYSYLSPFDRAGLYLAGAGTANERAAETVAVMRAEWKRMAEGGVTDEELDNAKRYLTGAYPLRFTSNGAIASILVGVQAAGLPIDYTETRNALVEAVTAEDVARVARRLLHEDALSIYAVGRPSGLGG